MLSEREHPQCRNQECKVSETGKCVEGLILEKCPHLGRSTPVTGESEASNDARGDERAVGEISVGRTDRLDIPSASDILRAAPAEMVAIIGPSLAGKTSLIASLCDLFQLGRVGTHSFARSRTFFAFESACHDARAASQRNDPEMAHTGRGTVGFYHLALRETRRSELVNVLLADRSGEDYQSVADDPANAAEFVEVRRADCITTLVSGEHLLNTGLRHNHCHEAIMTLQGLIDAGATNPKQRLAVVLTKLDLIASAEAAARARAEQDFEKFVLRAEHLFRASFNHIQPFKVAAAPKTKILEHGYGVSEVLSYWTAPKPPVRMPMGNLPPAVRAIGRFGMIGSGVGS